MSHTRLQRSSSCRAPIATCGRCEAKAWKKCRLMLPSAPACDIICTKALCSLQQPRRAGPPSPPKIATMTDHSTPRPEMRRAKARPRPASSAAVGWSLPDTRGWALGCLLLGVVTFLLVAAPVDLVRDRLIEQVKSRTGRDLVVSGPTSLVFFPRLAISLGERRRSRPRPAWAARRLWRCRRWRPSWGSCRCSRGRPASSGSS